MDFNFYGASSQQTLMFAGVGVLCAVFIMGSVFYGVRRRRRSTREERARLFGSTVKSVRSMNACIPIDAAEIRIQPNTDTGSEDDSVFAQSMLASNSKSGERAARRWSNRDRPGGLSVERPRWVSVSTDNLNKSSFDSDENKPNTLLWRLNLKTRYISIERRIAVDIFRATCSPAHHIDPTSSTVHAALVLEPSGEKAQTQYYANNGAPCIDETIDFHNISAERYDLSVLRVSLYDTDDATRNRVSLGHLRIPLNELPTDHDNYIDQQLTPRAIGLDSIDNTPEMLISLCYQPENSKLKLHITAARHLPDSPTGRLHYLRIQIIVGSQTVKVKRTTPSRSLSAIFQCSYVFQVPIRHLDATCLQIAVISTDEPPSEWVETVMGTVTIGSIVYAHTQGVEHWRQMMQMMRRTHEQWHKLVPPGAPTALTATSRPKLSMAHQHHRRQTMQIMSD